MRIHSNFVDHFITRMKIIDQAIGITFLLLITFNLTELFGFKSRSIIFFIVYKKSLLTNDMVVLVLDEMYVRKQYKNSQNSAKTFTDTRQFSLIKLYRLFSNKICQILLKENYFIPTSAIIVPQHKRCQQ